jgi:hypothetical protein
MGGIRWNLDKWANGFNPASNPAGLQDMTRVILAIAPIKPPTPLASATGTAGNEASAINGADWARQLVGDPAYQLK